MPATSPYPLEWRTRAGEEIEWPLNIRQSTADAVRCASALTHSWLAGWLVGGHPEGERGV